MSRRLKALRVGNFKAFADTQTIPIKPITLVFGPNSAGKSSFIHSLALAHEAQFGRDKHGRARLDVHHTDIGGNAIDLGGFRQFVHRGQMNRRVELGADLKLAELGSDRKYQQLAQLLAPVDSLALNISMGIELDNFDQPKRGAEPRVEAVEILADGEELLRMSRRSSSDEAQGDTLRLDRLSSEHAVFQRVIQAIIETNTTSTEMRPEDTEGANTAIADLLPQLQVRVDRFFPSGVDFPRVDGIDVPSTQMLFALSKGNRQDDIAQAVRFLLPRTLNDLVRGLAEVFAEELKQLQYLGPLRSFPPRHLAFAENEDSNWYAGGGYAWDVVRRDDNVRAAVNGWLGSDKLKTPYRLEVRSLVDTRSLLQPIEHGVDDYLHGDLDNETIELILEGRNVDYQQSVVFVQKRSEAVAEQIDRILSEWQPSYEQLTDPDEKAELIVRIRLEVNQEINKVYDSTPVFNDDDGLIWEQYQADIAKAIVDRIDGSDASAIRELVLFDIKKNTAVTHRDVGIGISQVLPVLVMAYGSQGKLLAMEQPEIHLHPALQAELADVFVESALGTRKNTFILETHSEHLILRLMRRIRERKVSPDDVAVIFVDPQSQGSRFIELRIDEEGDFIDEWPGGFFEESFHEKFAGR